MTIAELNEMTRDDLCAIEDVLIALAKIEHRETGDTRKADKASRALSRIAVRYSLVPADGYSAEVAR